MREGLSDKVRRRSEYRDRDAEETRVLRPGCGGDASTATGMRRRREYCNRDAEETRSLFEKSSAKAFSCGKGPFRVA